MTASCFFNFRWQFFSCERIFIEEIMFVLIYILLFLNKVRVRTSYVIMMASGEIRVGKFAVWTDLISQFHLD